MNTHCTICGKPYWTSNDPDEPSVIALSGDDRYCMTCAIESCEQRELTATLLKASKKHLSETGCSVFHQTIRQMVDEGWRFEWDLLSGFIGACHPMGGKQTICEIHGNSYIDKDRLGLGITKMLMDIGTPNAPADGKERK